MDPITPADVEFALHADAFVCVPITDYEVGQATLAYIKQHSAGTILLDAHGPTSTLVIGGERRRRLWVERDSWLPHIDLLKMNLEEAGCSWFPSEIELEHHDAGAPIATEQASRVRRALPASRGEGGLRHARPERVRRLLARRERRPCREDRAAHPDRARRGHDRRR